MGSKMWKLIRLKVWKFEWNILVVGRTDYGKTVFVKRLALNNFSGDLQKVE